MKTIKNLREEDYIPNSRIIEFHTSDVKIEQAEPETSPIPQRPALKKNTTYIDQSKKTIESSKVLISNTSKQDELHTFKL